MQHIRCNATNSEAFPGQQKLYFDIWFRVIITSNERAKSAERIIHIIKSIYLTRKLQLYRVFNSRQLLYEHSRAGCRRLMKPNENIVCSGKNSVIMHSDNYLSPRWYNRIPEEISNILVIVHFNEKITKYYRYSSLVWSRDYNSSPLAFPYSSWTQRNGNQTRLLFMYLMLKTHSNHTFLHSVLDCFTQSTWTLAHKVLD